MKDIILYPNNDKSKFLLKHKEIFNYKIAGMFSSKQELEENLNKGDSIFITGEDKNFNEFKEIIKLGNEANKNIIFNYNIFDKQTKEYILDNKYEVFANYETESEIMKMLSKQTKKPLKKTIKKTMLLCIDDVEDKLDVELRYLKKIGFKSEEYEVVTDDKRGRLFGFKEIYSGLSEYTVYDYTKNIIEEAEKSKSKNLFLAYTNDFLDFEDYYKMLKNMSLLYSFMPEELIIATKTKNEKIDMLVKFINIYTNLNSVKIFFYDKGEEKIEILN
ncbi:hypothetical protein [Haliovirga abyssi]|uniref:Uncharacterized protein n=1 Tax=Haliovirga abyssi TaxID=2996794 RepID=A0AAU9D0H1_9FUSO|nr:hypothetical protein [Haliovirga abyssi]BDU49451.1 hypothetical protein HLVA_00200 [Haliovirga abyssi]